jgi:hypothetical protein
MEDLSLKSLWTTYDRKLEKELALHHRIVAETQTQKARSVLRSLRAGKIFAIVLGIIWTLFLLANVIRVLSEMTPYSIFFVVSALAIAAATIAAIVVYIKQVILIQQIDNTMNIVAVREKLGTLQQSTINIARVLFLSAPFYSTFYFNKSMFEHGSIILWSFQLAITTTLTVSAVWLYRNIRLENADKRWFKFIFGKSEWMAVMKALNFLQELEAYDKE